MGILGFLGVSWSRTYLPCRRHSRHGFDPWVWKIPREEGTATPVFLPGESHGQRSLESYNPWGCKESDTTDQLNMHTHTQTHTQVF